MSAASQTRIFGMNVAIDPKILVGGLIALAALLFWYNSRSEPGGAGAPTAVSPVRQDAPLPVATVAARARVNSSRRQRATADRGTLRLRPVDATRGDIDPTIRLDLLAKVRSVAEPVGARNLFEIGAAPAAAALPKITGPIITPKPLPVPAASAHSTVIPMQVNIPLKYYGYVHSPDKNQSNRGLFLDGDNVLVATEGEFVKGRYLVVELTPNSAKMEDTQVKMGQVLPVVPVALP